MPEAPRAGSDDLEELTFEDALQQLEALVERLDGDDPPGLEDALDAYEQGTALARECLRRLDAAELRVERLSIDE